MPPHGNVLGGIGGGGYNNQNEVESIMLGGANNDRQRFQLRRPKTNNLNPREHLANPDDSPVNNNNNNDNNNNNNRQRTKSKIARKM